MVFGLLYLYYKRKVGLISYAYVGTSLPPSQLTSETSWNTLSWNSTHISCDYRPSHTTPLPNGTFVLWFSSTPSSWQSGPPGDLFQSHSSSSLLTGQICKFVSLHTADMVNQPGFMVQNWAQHGFYFQFFKYDLQHFITVNPFIQKVNHIWVQRAFEKPK
jgi:hypothetical protein